MSETLRPIAHAAQNPDGSWRDPHDLANHLAGVAALAACHARKFGAEDWAHLAGLWHDLGKYRPAFQSYIRNASGYEKENAHIESAGRVDHSTAGAVHAVDELGEGAGRLLAYLIAGHHAGLPDWNGDNASLFQRLEDARKKGFLKESLGQQPPEAILRGQRPSSRLKGGTADLHLWLRMLFSSLVDADFLDTENYMNSGKADARAAYPNIDNLLARFRAHMERLAAAAIPTAVNRIRADVLHQCIERAVEERGNGLYSLTVPTGGGKTLSALAFALHHAKEHKKRRVIYAIPYLSIIEQTADVFRGIFGEDVVEHHSNLDPDKESARSRLASENWDAPLIVTTNVQLFESLFAARTSRCRKLHNLVDSVVILDEAQLLPPEFLEPCLASIRTLSKYYGITFVLCTATQPAFQPREINGQFFAGLPDVRELMQGGSHVQDANNLYQGLDRVKVHWPDTSVTTTWDELAERVTCHDQTLAIVNRKTHARELAKRLPDSLYLSTDLCGAHRAARIEEIRIRLEANRERAKAGLPVCPLRVVSTQLIEAGVDVDFPVVFRALAGLDSIAQAAGRCNREGQLMRGEDEVKGAVHVFVPPEPAPSSLLLKGENATKELLSLDPNPALTPKLFEHYFRLWFASINSMDKEGILNLLMPGKGMEISFRTAAEKFHLIPDDGAPVIVRWGEAEKWLNKLKADGPDRWLMRKLQRYSVNVHRNCLDRLIAQHDVEEVLPGLYAQANDLLYDETFGFLGCAGNVAVAPGNYVF
ncbi:CRISPR-associated helicase Cas3 [Sulfuriferula plumbiphila]|uniref:CRISPR-associated helicase Cas3 n=1 Tax=Sulfuriferula plumbiphila TaxID=171865 RepID=A0A512L755_9PROT|nr:CRISPR-associated endonuclease Cas3'' [Sulfuriferula plumbiphila]BBP05277.1 CRISPR-associated helicase Cas3 [Sulfuriferula plumbiphila]GEP30315.1 CRISPR-associated helicase Cas3 [Sulfuriferula plumbiphila]